MNVLIVAFVLSRLFLCSSSIIVTDHDGRDLDQPLSSRAEFSGFQILSPGSLSDLGLNPRCEQVLYQSLNCDGFLSTFSSPAYRRSLEDEALTKSVCDTSCSSALETFHRRVAGSCASNPELIPGIPTLSLIDGLWGAWNETCLTDSETGKFCNDVIASWPDFESIDRMPKSYLCHYCFTQKLAVMQQNPFGIYGTGGYKDIYDTAVKVCQLQGVVTLPVEGVHINVTVPHVCPSSRYHTTRSGDTCDTIAMANKISSTSLYEYNPTLLDCDKPGEGSRLCLPLSCDKIYEVRNSDNCSSIAEQNEISWRDIVNWNGMIDDYCSNINNAYPNFGHVICVSPPGGRFNTPPANETGGGIGGPGGSGDGYAKEVVAPPTGARLADRTSLKCGEFYTAKASDTCRRILVASNTPSDLFIAVNPSLVNAQSCDSKLVVGLTYCLHPVRSWNETGTPSTTQGVGTLSPTPSTTKTLPTTTATPGKDISTDGQCGLVVNKTCQGSTFGNCCSSYGYCGSLNSHCAVGFCQSNYGTCTTDKPISSNGQCGGNSPVNATCLGSSFGDCCSSSGWCGKEPAYCGTDCQSLFGKCL
ncbi:hypothetical protein B0J11DRAFT_604462 [Dendryphion nanum]|uniref:Carbohydrate-binding module family 18 protein n=1 Tax=Dendryphion nanum TaxID=256645 RepID=A0A9P9DVU5_9PLEO|nr:hypothetical protein B0J11DRAFT_604462 [Dendryphion nanum]